MPTPSHDPWETKRLPRFNRDALPPPRPFRAKDMAATIGNVMRTLEVDDCSAVSDLRREWPKVLGATLARQSRPGPLSNAQLIVYVSNSSWLYEMSRFGKADILAKLQQRFGAQQIRDLRFQLDPDPPRNA